MAGTNYGVGGRKEGCVVRCFGEWVGNGRSDGRRRGGCGPGMPGPYGGWKGERVLAGNGQAEGSRPLPTM